MFYLIALALFIILALVVSIACYVVSDKPRPIEVNGARVVLTGGSDGLGLCLAQQLVQKGAHIVIIARNQAKLAKAVDLLKQCVKSEVRD